MLQYTGSLQTVHHVGEVFISSTALQVIPPRGEIKLDGPLQETATTKRDAVHTTVQLLCYCCTSAVLITLTTQQRGKRSPP